MKKAPSPIILAAVALVFGLGTGLGWFWFVARPMILAAKTASQPGPKAPARPEKPWDFWTLEVENLASELKEAKAALTAREDAVTAREARVVAEMAELAKLQKQIETLRSGIAERLYEVQAVESKNLKTLAATYSTLTPRSAVSILRGLDDATAVKLLGLMKTDVVGPIFEEMGRAGEGDPATAKRAATLLDKLRFYKASTAPGTASAP